jgi:hypothetical protein
MRRAFDFGVAPVIAAALAYWAATTGIRQAIITRQPVGGGAKEVIGQQVSLTFSGMLAGALAAAIAIYVIVRLARYLRARA